MEETVQQLEKLQTAKRPSSLMRWLKAVFFVLIGVLIAGMLAIAAVAAFRQYRLQKAVSTSKNFVSLIKSQNYESAYQLLGANYKKTFSQSDLKAFAATPVMQSALKGTESVGAKNLAKGGNKAQVTLQFIAPSGKQPIYFELQAESGKWLIRGISTQGNAVNP